MRGPNAHAAASPPMKNLLVCIGPLADSWLLLPNFMLTILYDYRP